MKPPDQVLADSWPPADAELVRLTTAFCDGRLTAAEGRQLAELLRDDASRAVYRRLVWLHVNLLRLWHEGKVMLPPLPPPPSDRRFSLPLPAGWLGRVAAGLLLAVGLIAAAAVSQQAGGLQRLVALLSPPLVEQRPPRQAGSIAEIIAVQQPVWAEGQPARSRYASIMPGDQLSLLAGLVEVAADTGSRIVLEGPTELTLHDPAVAQLDRGRATVSVGTASAGDGQPRFTLTTPSATVTDLGTSFGAAVSDTGQTAITVLAGLVELLPRQEGAAALRLAAGEAGVTGPQQPARRVDSPAERFVRSLPPGGSSRAEALRRFGWDQARATILLADAFTGSGPLAGTPPGGRGGIGEVAWQTPAAGWQLDPDKGCLVASSHGLATLPFQPEPGHRYQISVTIHTTAGGVGWGAIGLTDDADNPSYIPRGPWQVQRHRTDAEANRAYAGPEQTHPVGRGDRFGGEQIRTILLDTTGSRWRAVFFVAGTVLGEAVVDPKTAASGYVCLAAFPNSRVEFRHFSVAMLPR